MQLTTDATFTSGEADDDANQQSVEAADYWIRQERCAVESSQTGNTVRAA